MLVMCRLLAAISANVLNLGILNSENGRIGDKSRRLLGPGRFGKGPSAF